MAGNAGLSDLFLREHQIVPVSTPKNYTGAAATTEWVSLKDWQHVTFLIYSGAWAAGTAAVTLNQGTAVAGTGTTSLPFAYQYTATTPALVKTAVASDTFNVAAASTLHVVEVDASELTEGYDCVNMAIASPGSNADFYAVIAIMSKPRYPAQTAVQTSSIAD